MFDDYGMCISILGGDVWSREIEKDRSEATTHYAGVSDITNSRY